MPCLELYVAGCVLIIFIISPTILLIVYPTRLFRRCVSCCGFRKVPALQMFVESFQGQYKDRTNGTHDFRIASASFFVLRLLILASFHNYSFWISAGPQVALLLCALCFHAVVLILRILILALFLNHNCYTGSSLGQTALLASVTCVYITVRPYKLNFMTTVDILILFLLEILFLATCDSATSNPATALFNVLLIPTLLLYIPHMVLIFYICYMIAKKAGIAQYLQIKYRTLRRYVQAITSTGQIEADIWRLNVILVRCLTG